MLEYVETTAKEEHADKTSVYRRLLSKAIEEDRLEKAIALYREDKLTLLKAASIAEIPASVFLDELLKRNIKRGLGVEEIENGLRVLEKRLG